MRYFILGFFLINCLLRVEANQTPLCAYIYYGETDYDYINDMAINRVQEINVDDGFSSQEYTVELSDDNIYRDIIYADNADRYLSYQEDESLGDAYGFYLSAAYEGAERVGDLYFVDNVRHLRRRWVDSTFVGSVGAAWSGDGRLAYAWNADDNGNEISDDNTIYLAIYNPLIDRLQSNSFINSNPDATVWMLGWSADKRYFALLEKGYTFYDYHSKDGFEAARIWIISAESLEAVPLAGGDTLMADSFAWSPNANEFAYTLGNQVFVGSVGDQDYRSYITGENENYYETLLPNWSADGHYVAITQADENVHWSHFLLDVETGTNILLNGGDTYYSNAGIENTLTWSSDSQRWLYPQASDNGYSLLAYDMQTGSELKLIASFTESRQLGFIDADGLQLASGGVWPGIVGEAPLYAVVIPDENLYRVALVHDNGETTPLLDKANLVDMRWIADNQYLMVITAQGESETNSLRMTARWFNREGLLLGTYQSEILSIANSVSEPYPAVLLLSRTGLTFEALLLNFESSQVNTLVSQEESYGSPYGYWNANWWFEFPSPDYIALSFEQPYPIYWWDKYLFNNDGTDLEPKLNDGIWTEDGRLVLLADYQSVETDNYSQTLVSVTLQIIEPEGVILWEETIPASEHPYSWFWGACGMYQNS